MFQTEVKMVEVDAGLRQALLETVTGMLNIHLIFIYYYPINHFCVSVYLPEHGLKRLKNLNLCLINLF